MNEGQKKKKKKKEVAKGSEEVEGEGNMEAKQH